MFKWLVQFFHNLFQIQTIEKKVQKENSLAQKLFYSGDVAEQLLKEDSEKEQCIIQGFGYDLALKRISDSEYLHLPSIFRFLSNQVESKKSSIHTEVNILLLDTSSRLLKYPKFCRFYCQEILSGDSNNSSSIIKIPILFGSNIELYLDLLNSTFKPLPSSKDRVLYDAIFLLLGDLMHGFGLFRPTGSPYTQFNFTVITDGDDNSSKLISSSSLIQTVSAFRSLPNWNFHTIGFHDSIVDIIQNIGFPLEDNFSLLSDQDMDIFEERKAFEVDNTELLYGSDNNAKVFDQSVKVTNPSSNLDDQTVFEVLNKDDLEIVDECDDIDDNTVFGHDNKAVELKYHNDNLKKQAQAVLDSEQTGFLSPSELVDACAVVADMSEFMNQSVDYHDTEYHHNPQGEWARVFDASGFQKELLERLQIEKKAQEQKNAHEILDHAETGFLNVRDHKK